MIEYAEALTVTPAAADDDLRQRLAETFTRKQIVELTNTISWENARARFNRGLDIQSDGFAQSTD